MKNSTKKVTGSDGIPSTKLVNGRGKTFNPHFSEMIALSRTRKVDPERTDAIFAFSGIDECEINMSKV
jgi:hypothetical protein